MGRFINRDPIAEAGGVNLYAYCGNNAAMLFDALGEEEYRYLSEFFQSTSRIETVSDQGLVEQAKKKQEENEAAEKVKLTGEKGDGRKTKNEEFGAGLVGVQKQAKDGMPGTKSTDKAGNTVFNTKLSTPSLKLQSRNSDSIGETKAPGKPIFRLLVSADAEKAALVVGQRLTKQYGKWIEIQTRVVRSAGEIRTSVKGATGSMAVGHQTHKDNGFCTEVWSGTIVFDPDAYNNTPESHKESSPQGATNTTDLRALSKEIINSGIAFSARYCGKGSVDGIYKSSEEYSGEMMYRDSRDMVFDMAMAVVKQH